MKDKVVLVSLLFSLGGFWSSSGQTIDAQRVAHIPPSDSTEADRAWTRQPKGPRPIEHLKDSNGIIIEGRPLTSQERINLNYQRDAIDSLYKIWGCAYIQWGIDFWHHYPYDKRRYRWLYNAMQRAPACFLHNIYGGLNKLNPDNINKQFIDCNGRSAWQKQYFVFRNVFMSDTTVSKKDRCKFQLDELGVYLNENKYERIRKEEGFNLDTIAHRILALAPLFYQNVYDSAYAQRVGSKDELSTLVFKVFNDGIKFYKLTYDDISRFLHVIENSPYELLSKYAGQVLSFLSLQQKPIQIRCTSVSGREIDLEKLRGKIILLDFWSLSCGFCINKMPEVKMVYEKYRNQGFEVISIACNPEIDRLKVLKVHKTIGADWPLLLIGGNSKRSGFCAPNSLMWQIWHQYGFKNVPQLLLLDKEGKLAAYNDKLLYPGGVEKELTELLNKL